MRNLTALRAGPDATQAYLANLKARDYVRWIMALAETGGDDFEASERFAHRWPESKSLDLIRRAAMEPGTTTGDTWGDQLSPINSLASAFIELIRPRSILGRISGMRAVPFDVSFPRQTSSAGVSWTAEGAPVMVSELAFERETFEKSKIGGICVISRELARSSDPAAESLIQRDLADSIATFTDTAFLDPTVAEVPDVSPASIANGAVSVAATGTTAAAFKNDARALIAAMVAAGGQLASPVWVMTPLTAMSLNLLGVDDRLGLNGGFLLGAPVLTGNGVPANPGTGSPVSGDGARIYLIDAAEVLMADGGLELSSSGQGALQMNTAPTNPPTASTVTVSLWEEGLTAIKALRYLRWARRSAGSVGFIDSSDYGASS